MTFRMLRIILLISGILGHIRQAQMRSLTNTYTVLWSRDHLIDLQITNLIDIYN